jgi:hypothetical protein
MISGNYPNTLTYKLLSKRTMPEPLHKSPPILSHLFNGVARRELAVSIVVGIFSLVSGWLIKDELKRTIVVISGMVVILLISQLPRFYRFLRSSLRLYSTFYQRTHIQHQLIHQLRDACIQILPPVPAYSSPIMGPDENGKPKPNPQLLKNRAEIQRLLERVVDLFQPFVPEGARIWACLRDRRADNCYYTFERAGTYDKNREISSSPLHKDTSQVVSKLKERYKRDGVCVLITGSTNGPEMWEVKENDRYGEDKSVMLGAVMTRSWGGDEMTWKDPKLAWIIGVCTDHENAFDKKHIHLMRQCVDVFSILANIMIRH